MARSKKRSSRSIVLHQDVEIEVTEIPFKTFDSIRHLDAARLSRAAKARFEVGTFESGCCRRAVHAVVRKGMVTKLEIEPCKKFRPATPEMKRAIQAAMKKLAPRPGDAPSLPMPVSQFLASPIGPHFSTWLCIKICCFGHCLICCFRHKFPWHFYLGCAIDEYPLPN